MSGANLVTSSQGGDLHEIFSSNKLYLYALNGNLQNENGNRITLQNEHSNFLCSIFKEGYSYVHHQLDRANDTTYYFLYNKETGCSEIGKIKTHSSYEIDDIEKECGCNYVEILAEPLEDSEQEPLCTYETIVTDCCNPCLNFGEHHNISSEIKNENDHTYLYFAQENNPRRRIDLGNINQYRFNYDDCGDDEPEDICFDCDKLRVDVLHSPICIKPHSTLYNGNLPEGAYSALVAYCDIKGEELTRYMSDTNWAMVNNMGHKIYMPHELDRNSGQGIRFKVENADDNFKYYTVVIMQESATANLPMNYYSAGVFPINQEFVDVTDLRELKRKTIDEITKINPTYKTAKYVAQANNTLFWEYLTKQEEVNLQPIVNLIGQFAKVRTVMANEDLYSDGVMCALYEEYMGDEGYAHGLVFTTNTGYKSSLFPLISRAPKRFSLDGSSIDQSNNSYPFETDLIDETDGNYAAINSQYRSGCNAEDRNKWFQYYNTATIIKEGGSFENCVTDDVLSKNEQRVIKRTVISLDDSDYIITSLDVELISSPSSSPSKNEDYVFDNLSNYWYIHEKNIMANGSTWSDPFKIREALTDTSSVNYIESPDDTYINTLFPPTNCDETPTLLPTQTPKAIIVDDGELVKNPDGTTKFTRTYKSIDDYKIPAFDGYCTNISPSDDPTKSKYKSDYDASEALITGLGIYAYHEHCDIETILRYGKIVNKRPNGMATECSASLSIPISNNNVNYSATAFISPDIKSGATNSTYSGNTHSASQLNAPDGRVFLDKLHTNAVWHKIENNDSTNLTFLLSKASDCSDTKDQLVYSEYVRVTVYDSCDGGVGDIVYSQIYSVLDGVKFALDGDAPTVSPGMVVPTGVQFKPLENKTYYIALDTPIIDMNKTIDVEIRNGYDADSSCKSKVTLQGKILAGTCGCLQLKVEKTKVLSEKFTIQNAIIKKSLEYTKNCIVKVYGDISCTPQLWEEWDFAYNESTKKYPCNKELWDSSSLTITQSNIPDEFRAEFESVFVESISSNGEYVLKKDSTNFVDKPIRHFKYPDIKHHADSISDREDYKYGSKNKIFPKGLWISNKLINSMLDVAVQSNLITQEFRDSIVGFEVYRGERRTHRSVIAKGLGFDMLTYTDRNNKKWQTQNYPFNDYRKDILHSEDMLVPIGEEGSRFSFLSPNTFWNRPTLNSNLEIKYNYHLYGETKGNFVNVEDYPKMVLLSPQAYSAAEKLAWIEVALKQALIISNLLGSDNEVFRTTFGFSNSFNIGGIIARAINIGVTMASVIVNTLYDVGRIKSEWIKVYYTNGNPKNFASMYVGQCRYESVAENTEAFPISNGNTLRPASYINYLLSERYETNGIAFQDIRVDNNDRDDVVYINLGNRDDSTLNRFNFGINGTMDTSRYIASEVDACSSSPSRDVLNRVASSPYLSIKNYTPDQYGNIENIVWLSTNYCGSLKRAKNSGGNLVLETPNDCDVIFGGDTFISRYSHKRKMRMFYADIFGAPSLTPFNHSEYSAYVNAKYYIDYNNQMTDNLAIVPYPTIKSGKKLDCYETNGNYISGKSKFYAYYFSIASFMVESEYNCNFRYGQNDKELNYYENCGDVIKWCQPKNVPFIADNWNGGYAATIYSKDLQIQYSKILDAYYNKKEWRALNNMTDRVIYSDVDSQENRVHYDPYMTYRANNRHDFGKKLGSAFGLVSLDDMRVLGRFEDGYVIFNAYSKLEGSIETYTLGDGGIFHTRPSVQFQSELGYGGTQHSAYVSCVYGVFWCDAKRGQVFNIGGREKRAKEISQLGDYNWFKEHLPFQILKDFPSLPHRAIDNPRLGLGIAMGWDERYGRVFVTKRDARVKEEFVDKVTFVDNFDTWYFVLDEGLESEKNISIDDSTYFDDYSWTRAYMPSLESSKDASPWISFYSFKPHFYVNHIHYFQTGFKDRGLWSHLISNRSYQVFYGELYPFKLITSIEEKYVNQIAHHFEYWLDVIRYKNEKDEAENIDANFDWACVFSKNQNSGKLNLVNSKPNDYSQIADYPKFNSDSVDIISSLLKGRFTINQFYDLVANKRSNVPIWIDSNGGDDMELNNKTIDYGSYERNRIVADVIKLLLVQEKESRLKYIIKFITHLTNPTHE